MRRRASRRCIFFQTEQKMLACPALFSATLNSAVKHEKRVEICLYWQEKQNHWAEEIAQAFQKGKDKTYALCGKQMRLQLALAPRDLDPAFQELARAFIRKEQPELVLSLVQKQLPQLSLEEQSFVAEFAEALAKQQGMNAENGAYVRRLARRMQASMGNGSLHLEGFARFRLADLRQRWQKCIERVVSMAVLRYDWAQQLDAWRLQISQSQSRCSLVRVHKNLKGQFVLEVQGYQGESPRLPEEQPAEEALLSMLLSWAPERIEILLGENRQESWVYEIIEQVFGPRVRICWCQH